MTVVQDVFDYIIVGAGAAGCLLAQRLIDSGNSTVCLLEAGAPDNSLLLRIPAGVYKTATNSKYAWPFETAPNPATANRAIPVPQGRTLGGSTSINGMIYNRGQAADFDEWAGQGCRGWGYADILPYFKRTERRLAACDEQYRGTGGSLPITDCDWRHPVCDAFIAAMHNVGLPRNPDYNGAAQTGAGYYQRYIAKGWRVSAATAFLRPVARHKNLSIRTAAQATAIVLEGKRAVGVRYAHAAGEPAQEVRARREVIICAGAANTPKLLQLSGIGPAELLTELGIPLVHELPGVGKNLQDHYAVHLILRLKGTTTVNGHGLALLREAAKWALGRPNFLAISPSIVYAFVNSKDVRSTPDILLDVALGNYSDNLSERYPVLKVGFYDLRPRSTGFVRAVSPEPFRSPIIQPNYLVDERDQRVVIDGTRTVSRLMRAPELQPFYDTEVLPGPAAVTDADYLDFAQQVGLTSYHLCGTCRMGTRSDPGSVVDDQLRVYGLEGLRVADASIMPAVPSANTSAAVFMIAEKASDMILGRQPLPAIALAAPAVQRAPVVRFREPASAA